MNATLTYAVDLFDVPKELKHQLDYVHRELAEISRDAHSAGSSFSGGPDDKEVLQLLHNIRIHMAKVDTRLEDCMSILSGYVDFLENPPESEEEIVENDSGDGEAEQEVGEADNG